MKMGNVEKFNEANINDDLKKCEFESFSWCRCITLQVVNLPPLLLFLPTRKE